MAWPALTFTAVTIATLVLVRTAMGRTARSRSDLKHLSQVALKTRIGLAVALMMAIKAATASQASFDLKSVEPVTEPAQRALHQRCD